MRVFIWEEHALIMKEKFDINVKKFNIHLVRATSQERYILTYYTI